MRRAVIFQACVVCAVAACAYAIQGKQTRRARDEDVQRAAAAAAAQAQARAPVAVAAVGTRQDGGGAVSA